MPYLQEPEVGKRLRYSRSDHTIPIPRLGLDRIFGIENACMKCHSDYSFDAMRDTLLERYGTLKPLKGLVEGVIRAQRAPSRLEAARLELSPGDGYEVLEYTGLAYFFLNHLSPDMPALEAEIVERLKQLTESDDVDIQALALTSLHLARGKDPQIRSFLSKKLGTLGPLGPRDEEIRRRWVWILNFRADIFRLRGDHREALVIYEKAQEILPGDPTVLRNLGIAYSSLGAYGKAIASLRRSLEVDPVQTLTLVNLAFALTQQGDFSSGLEVYRQAIEMNPYEPNSYLSLGNALLRQGMVEAAVDALERAVALDPSLSEAHFTLGLAYVEQDSYDDAVAALNRGLEFDPTGAGAQALIDALQRRGVRASP
jgi:tetratricopeptide (TPR) repeat protein